MKDAWKLLAAACAVVVGIYAYTAPLGRLESLYLKAADSYYNLLVQGFRAGQLSLKKEAPPGLAQLADPYDPAANGLYQGRYRLRDLSYYKGRLYTYFGVTPALILFWPFVGLTGHYLSDRQAVTIFCAIGVLASVGLLRALWRRYFAEVSVGVVVACALALGLASGLQTMLPRSEAHDVAASCGYMLTMLALAAVWCALHQPRKRSGWLAVASLAYGLAVGSRPNLLFGAAMLLVPVAQAWRERLVARTRHERRKVWTPLMAATGPIVLIGLGLMLYNAQRFDNPFEFGLRYQLGGWRQVTLQFFSLRYLWFNFQAYFLEPARWSGRFPFVHALAVPPLPWGSYGADAFGILTNVPLVWLALAVPLAWRSRPGQAGSILQWFVTAVALLFGICALTISTFIGPQMRYAVDFLPALVLLAVVGILGLERVLTPTLASNRIRGQESGQACRPVWQRAARWGWGVLLGFSVAFNVLVSVEKYAYVGCGLANDLVAEGWVPEAMAQYEQALRLNPDYAEAHNNLGFVLKDQGKVPEAIAHYEQALRLNPDYAEAHYNLGIALAEQGKVQEAVEHYEQAVRIKPDYAEAHNNLGNALREVGRVQDAIGHFEQALQIKPDYAEAYYNLALAFRQVGKLDEAIHHYERAVQIKPDFAAAHNNLGNVLVQAGRVQDGIGHYEQAVRIKPDYADAHLNLGGALLQLGRPQEAIGHWEQALRIKPDYAVAHYNLGLALEQAGRLQDAIGHFEQALRLKPDFTQAQNGLARLQAGQ
jgi:tetratricopeptide (TPR) repeat protein